MRILITDGHSRSALAATRSLGKRGHQIFVGAKSQRSLAGISKYCEKTLVYPDPNDSPNEFVAAVCRAVLDFDIEIVLPMTDVCVMSLADQRQQLEPSCLLPLADSASILRAADKSHVFRRAQELGVPVPASVLIEHSESISSHSIDLPFPVVVKPCRSRVLRDNRWLSTSVSYANSFEQLQDTLRELPLGAFPVLLQERIAGPGIGLFYCCDHGEPVASFAHRRLREKPPSGGVSVLRESVPIDATANEDCIRLLRDLEWHGVAMVEMKRDIRDGSARLMEVNGRFWGSLQLAIDSGVDFPGILVDLATGKKVDTISTYETGVRSRWFWGECDLLLMYLLHDANQLALPEHHGSRTSNMLRILNPFVRKQKFEVLRFSDIRPWLFEGRQWFGQFFR